MNIVNPRYAPNRILFINFFIVYYIACVMHMYTISADFFARFFYDFLFIVVASYSPYLSFSFLFVPGISLYIYIAIKSYECQDQHFSYWVWEFQTDSLNDFPHLHFPSIPSPTRNEQICLNLDISLYVYTKP